MRASELVLVKLKDAGVRPAVLAKALDIDRSTASLMLAGKRGIATWHLDAIAGLLGVDVPQLFVSRPIVKTVQKSTVQSGTRVANSPVPASAGSEGTHAPHVVASTLNLKYLDGLSLPERVAAAHTIAMQLAILLRNRPEASGADAAQPKRSTGRR